MGVREIQRRACDQYSALLLLGASHLLVSCIAASGYHGFHQDELYKHELPLIRIGGMIASRHPSAFMRFTDSSPDHLGYRSRSLLYLRIGTS